MRRNNALLQRAGQVNTMKSIQNNPLLNQFNRGNVSNKVVIPNGINGVILNQKKVDAKLDLNNFNHLFSSLEKNTLQGKDKLWEGRTNQPYKNIMPPEMFKKNYKSKEELVVYQVKKEDKDEKAFKEKTQQMKQAIEQHNVELKNTFSSVKQKDYANEFEYNNILKYKVKYDPEKHEEMKEDVIEYYKKEQQELEKDKQHVDEIIEGMITNGLTESITPPSEEIAKEKPESPKVVFVKSPDETKTEPEPNNIKDKYLKRQKKI